MYKVYADNLLIHDARSPSIEVHLVDPVLKLVDSSAGSFEFTMTPLHVGYSYVERFTTTIIVYEDDTIIWTGRILRETEDFWRRRKFTCEGALSFLNDSQQPLHYYKNINSDTFFTSLLNVHNTRVPSNRQVQVGTITKHDSFDRYEYKTDYQSTYETIQSEFIERLGGHIRVRYNGSNPMPIIDYLDSYPNTSVQEINFGENLLEFTRNWDLSQLCTVIIPRGKQLDEENEEGDTEYLTIATVNDGSIYLQNDTTVATYGTVERVVDFNDIDNPTLLKQMGTLYLQANQFDEMVLDVSAIDLHMLNSTIRSFKLLDEVLCVSQPHGLSKIFPISEIEIPLDKPDEVKYTLGGTESTTMTSQAVTTGNSIQSQLRKGLLDTLLDAKRNAASLINSATTGYVNIITENETSQALVITNTPNIENATKLWRFNLNGLGYSEDGGETYKLAMTMDGVIVADFIRTGVIDDGHGYNRWNLNTGEFQMAYNTEIANLLGETIQVVDIVQLAQDGVDDAAAAQSDATTALHKQVGGTNLLNGTNKNLTVVTSGNSNWSKGTWDGNLGATASKTIVDISGAPNASIVKGFKIQLQSTSESYVVQRGVKVTSGQVYVMSCYAKGTGKVALGFYYPNEALSKSISDVTNNWKRYSLVFRVDSGKSSVNIVFGASGSSGNTVYICGLQLERGNTATDWMESNEDSYTISTTNSAKYTDATAEVVKDFGKSYTDTISAADRQFTKDQRTALDNSFTQYKVLQRLTNNFAAKGIYLQNNQLYMNATYVRTGTLDAGIIKAGILTDKNQNNKWNMATGYLYTNKMEANNIQANGRFQSGAASSYRMILDGGELNGYRPGSNTSLGAISPNASIRNLSTGQLMYGLTIRGRQVVDIRTPYISVDNNISSGHTATLCISKTLRIDYVREIRAYGNGGWEARYGQVGIKIINGLIVALDKVEGHF